MYPLLAKLYGGGPPATAMCAKYGTFCIAFGSAPDVVIWKPNTLRLSPRKTVPLLSVTANETPKNPSLVGVPDSTPPAESDNPGGIEPFGAHVAEPTLPVMVSV